MSRLFKTFILLFSLLFFSCNKSEEIGVYSRKTPPPSLTEEQVKQLIKDELRNVNFQPSFTNDNFDKTALEGGAGFEKAV